LTLGVRRLPSGVYYVKVFVLHELALFEYSAPVLLSSSRSTPEE
jgi:hypothetical protein